VIGEHIKLEACYDGHLPQVYVDRGHLEQVLVNLCVNARDAMQAGGSIRIETSVRRFDAEFVSSNPWAREGEFVLVSVADTGAGMPPDVLEHIFEPFFTTKEVGRGTGLGLAIVYGIVNQHGGLIQVESHEGKGSTFRIFLPAVREGASALEDADHPPPSASLGSETILVAEDEELVRDLVVRILRRAGYRVHVARDGEEALEIFAREWKDLALVILDVVMPRLGGRAAWEAMKATNPHVRVLFSTGYDFDTLEMSESADARVSVIQKPFSPATLLSKVRTLIDTKEGSELH
jgi:CheY-like chemotaxis protein